MTFTEEDAENDGKIKREAGREMAKVAQQVNPEAYEHFLNVCDSRGIKPANLLGEMAVKALNSEAYAEQVFNTEVNMRSVQQNEIRKEDVEFVTEIESMFRDDSGNSKDPIDELIEDRIRNMASSPVSQMRESVSHKSESDDELKEYLAHMNRRMEEMEDLIAQSSDVSEDDVSTDDRQDLDNLFGEDEPEPEPEPEPESEPEPEPEEDDDEIKVNIANVNEEPELEPEPQGGEGIPNFEDDVEQTEPEGPDPMSTEDSTDEPVEGGEDNDE